MRYIKTIVLLLAAPVLAAAAVTGTLTPSGNYWFFPVGGKQTIIWTYGEQDFYGQVRAGIEAENWLQFSGSAANSPVLVGAHGSDIAVGLQVESKGLSSVTLSPALALPRLTLSGSAVSVSSDVLRLEAVCGTSAGTMSLIAMVRSGTSTVSASIADNLGYGISGC